MGFKITARTDFSGEHMGLVFLCGVAHTDDAFLATRLRSKGYTITSEDTEEIVDDPQMGTENIAEVANDPPMGTTSESSEDYPDEPPELPPLDEADSLDDLENMTVAQLKDLAAENGIDLGSAKTKADIISVISAVTV